MFPNITIPVVGWAVIFGILLGIFIDLYRTPYVQIVYATRPVEQPKEVKLDVIYNWTEERIVEEIQNTFPEAPELAVAIAKAESELFTRALNPEAHRGCHGSYGIFQIACVHVSNPTEMYNPKANIKKAREIYLQHGWQPWGAYTDGRYRLFL